MTEKEYSSFLHQLGYVYAANKKSENPCKLMFTGVSEQLKTELVVRGASYWPIGIHSESYIDRLPKDQLVYLTADSSETLEEFDPNKAYIIGGMVDHNRLKHATIDKAHG